MAEVTPTSMSDPQHTQAPTRGRDLTTKTIRSPPFSYAHLQLLSDSGKPPTLDVLTVRTYLTAALKKFLGLAGTAISVDILKVEGNDVWLRVPREDLSAVAAATGGWIGGGDAGSSEKVKWQVKATGNWLSTMVGDQGIDEIWDK
jgi:ribonuclease P/MRP protein subunit POP8